MVNIGNVWDQVLEGEFEKEYYQKLRAFLIQEYRTRTIYPGMYDIFNALKYTPYDQDKAVILGQDPYHEPGQAHGMSFSVKKGVKQPPSLVNIFRELEDDLGISPPDHGYLMKWAEEGVLLLNTCLTVREHQANSHRGKGWEIFTDRVISLLNADRVHPVGSKRQIKSAADHRKAALDSYRGSSQSAFGVQRIFRRQVFFQNQCVSGGKRREINRLGFKEGLIWQRH